LALLVESAKSDTHQSPTPQVSSNHSAKESESQPQQQGKYYSTDASSLHHHYYFHQWKDTLAKSLWFRPENRKRRVIEFVSHLERYGISQRVYVTRRGTDMSSALTGTDASSKPRILYAVPITSSLTGEITDVYYASRLHYLGYASLLLPFIMRLTVSKRSALLSCLLVFISRYFTYEVYYDANMRWRRRGIVSYFKSMGMMGMMGVFLAVFPFHSVWESREVVTEDSWGDSDRVADILKELWRMVSSILTYV